MKPINDTCMYTKGLYKMFPLQYTYINFFTEYNDIKISQKNGSTCFNICHLKNNKMFFVTVIL